MSMLRRWGWYREQRFPLDSTLRERCADLWDRLKTRRAEQEPWAQAESLRELGGVTALWLEGEIKYHPNGYDDGPDSETTDLVPALAALNRSGFVTDSSQPGIGPTWGYDGNVWWQRAAVDGYTDSATADWLEAAANDAGLIVIRKGKAGWRTSLKDSVPVTISPDERTGDPITEDTPYYPHTHFGAHLSRRQVKFGFDCYGANALCEAEQVTFIDPEWGRNDLLWPTLTGITPRQTETRYSLEIHDPDGTLHESHAGLTFEQVRELDKKHDTSYSFRMTGWNYVDPADEVATPPGPFFPDAPPTEWMDCPDCDKRGCETCGGDGLVPTWLKDPNVMGEAARSWGWNGSTNEENTTNGGSVMTAPTGTGDVVSIADLRDVYERTGPAMAGVAEQQSAAAAGFRAQAASYEAAVGGLTSEGHDAQTIAEASQAMEAMHEAARLSEEAAAAADAAQGTIAAALQGLERHRALEEAVASHAGPATRTDAYAPR